jgi:C_GCAxxG_C_C family probable redox protein
MLSEYYLGNIYGKHDLNCAESVVHTANEVYGIDLSEEALKLPAAFGGGMYIEEKCGAVTGSLMVLGYLFVEENAHSTEFLKEIVHDYFSGFSNKMGSCECAPLKKRHRSDDYGCRDVIAAALDVLESVLDKHKNKRVR